MASAAPPDRRVFITVAAVLAILALGAAKLVASWLLDVRLRWVVAVTTALVVGAVVTLAIIGARGKREGEGQEEGEGDRQGTRHTEFQVEAQDDDGGRGQGD